MNYIFVMLELLLKLPKDKPPFVGIVFETEYKAEQTNAEWVNSYHTHIYRLNIEPQGGSINLRLVQDGIGCNCLYKGLKHDPEALLKFLFQTRNIRAFNFGHVVRNGDNIKLVKSATNRRNFVLRIEAVRVLIEY